MVNVTYFNGVSASASVPALGLLSDVQLYISFAAVGPSVAVVIFADKSLKFLMWLESLLRRPCYCWHHYC